MNVDLDDLSLLEAASAPEGSQERPLLRPPPPAAAADAPRGVFTPTDRYLPAGPELQGPILEIFNKVVRGMQPGFYKQMDYHLIVSYAMAQHLLNQMQASLPPPEEFVVINGSGGPVLNPLLKGYQNQVATVAGLAVKVRVAASSRAMANTDPSAAPRKGMTAPDLSTGDASEGTGGWRSRLQ